LAPDCHLLLMNLHHIAGDAWSIRILEREIQELYERRELAPVMRQYKDYAQWQRAQPAEVLEKQLEYWRKQLGDPGALVPISLPCDRPHPAAGAFRADLVPFTVDQETVRALRALAARHGATMFMTLLAVFKLSLRNWTGQAAINVGCPIAGRTRLEFE